MSARPRRYSSVRPGGPIAAQMREPSATAEPTAARHKPVGALERLRRAEALARHHEDKRSRSAASAGELGYLRAQLRLATRLTARLAATNDVHELGALGQRKS